MSHQRQGVAAILLDAACKFGIYGMEVKKEVEGVAFRFDSGFSAPCFPSETQADSLLPLTIYRSQPTQSGQALMNGWGRGLVRVFVEDP